MSIYSPRHDILLPATIDPTDMKPLRTRLAAFVPITLAIIGISAILFGGVSARHHEVAEQTQAIDPITTGSIN
jgi:hypothetical protein